MKNKQELVNRIIDFYLTGHNLKEDEAKAVISLKEEYKAINYTRCCTELNPEFAIGEQVLLTKKTVVTIETFCEDGMIEVDDNNEYYKVDKEELTKRV
jgi:hypothetical protein